MRTGIYGGTFSPPHIGHIAAARAFVEQLDLDELLIIPALIPPHKKLDYVDDPNLRFELCRLAFSDVPKAEVSDIELLRGGISYTADTLRELTCQGRELFLLCGTDMIMTIDTWREPEVIFDLCTPVYIRREDNENATELLKMKLKSYKRKFGVAVPRINAPAIGISSSELRAAVRENIKISEFVTPQVEKYIIENGMFR